MKKKYIGGKKVFASKSEKYIYIHNKKSQYEVLKCAMVRIFKKLS